jgi:hypothetical protein
MDQLLQVCVFVIRIYIIEREKENIEIKSERKARVRLIYNSGMMIKREGVLSV